MEEKIVYIDPKKIEVKKGFNPRSNIQSTLTEDFLESIKNKGVLQPLRAAKGKRTYMLIDGERRLRAVFALMDKKIKIPKVPVIIEKPKNETEALILTLTLAQGEKLDPLDEAKAFERIMKDGVKKKDLAKTIGRHITTIENRLALLKAPPEVKAAMESGKITKTEASKASKKPTKKEVKKEIKKLVKAKKEKALTVPEMIAVYQKKVEMIAKPKTPEEDIWIRGIIHGICIAANIKAVLSATPKGVPVPKMVHCKFKGGKNISLEKCADITSNKKGIFNDCRECKNYRTWIVKDVKVSKSKKRKSN